VQALGRARDVLVDISTEGTRRKAMRAALQPPRMNTHIALTGSTGGKTDVRGGKSSFAYEYEHTAGPRSHIAVAHPVRDYRAQKESIS